MICDNCNAKVSILTGAVLAGKFGKYCVNCIQKQGRSAHAGHATYLRARDREDNLRDLIQPWDRHGRPNPEFIREYPEEAKLNFSEEELNNYG